MKRTACRKQNIPIKPQKRRWSEERRVGSVQEQRKIIIAATGRSGSGKVLLSHSEKGNGVGDYSTGNHSG